MDESKLNASILHLLEQNARIAVDEIAARLEVDAPAVDAAIDQMKKDQVIMGYTTLLNEDRLASPPVRALIEVEVVPDREGGFDRVARRLSRFPEVRAVSLLSGSYDLSLEVVGSTLHEVAYFVSNKLSVMDGVKATRTHFLLKKYKQAGIILHEVDEHERLKVVP